MINVEDEELISRMETLTVSDPPYKCNVCCDIYLQCLVVEPYNILNRLYCLKQLSFRKLSNENVEDVVPDTCGQHCEQKCRIKQNGSFQRLT